MGLPARRFMSPELCRPTPVGLSVNSGSHDGPGYIRFQRANQ